MGFLSQIRENWTESCASQKDIEGLRECFNETMDTICECAIPKYFSECADRIKECYEEVGLRIKNPILLKISKAGATIVWDLYYFLIKDFVEDQQHLEDGEDITVDWYTMEEVKELCLNNKIQEDRSVAVILKYLISQNQK